MCEWAVRLVAVAVATTLSVARGDASFFTSVADMQQLVPLEAVLSDALQAYIAAQERRLQTLRRYAEDYQKQHEAASADVELYLANPINAYLLIKRLTSDWRRVEALMSNNVGADVIANITAHRDVVNFPTDEDLSGAAVALTRLQDTYRLDAVAVARGAELFAGDCFEVGRQAYHAADYRYTALWMREADARLAGEASQTATATRSDILEYLAFATFKQGNTPLALQLTNKLLEIIPTHQRALGNKAYYEEAIAKIAVENRKREEKSEVKSSPVENRTEAGRVKKASSKMPELEYYKMLCRGDAGQSTERTSQLRCMYTHNNQPFLRIAPFKIEEAHADPGVVVFHGVISDAEIETMKRLVQPRLKRAESVDNLRRGAYQTPKRINKLGMVSAEEHPHVANVYRRLEHMTGLTVSSAEKIQVSNYGIGGHNAIHVDFLPNEKLVEEYFEEDGNRIATVLFYMSDVAQGGATVFPQLSTAVLPRKGTAALWYNLLPSGQVDYRTKHAACPVLFGSKWVSVAWLHEKGQEFRRPCELTKNQRKSQKRK